MIDIFEQHRSFMFGVAYRMTGSAMDAEDLVQEAFLRFQEKLPAQIDNPRAYFGTIMTRLSLNFLNSAHVKREAYVGPWLPEPIRLEEGFENTVLAHESISMAFLVLMEQLSPLERAVFLLREVFEYEYSEIATMLEKDEAACRQLLSRAKKHIQANRPRFEYSQADHERILGQFLHALGEGSLEGLLMVLAEDVTVLADGGGKVAAATRPIVGREAVARFFVGLRRLATEAISISVETINGRPAMVAYDSGVVFGVFAIDVQDGLIRAFHITRNPDKLKRI